jgi:predicted XRE-type DNA-binding protein
MDIKALTMHPAHNICQKTTIKQEVTLVKQTDIATLTGISQSQLSRIFDGKPYGFNSAVKIGSVLNLPWQDVFALKPLKLYTKLAQKVEEVEADNAN